VRVLIGAIEIAGVGQGLTQGLRALGVDADLVLESEHPFAYGGAEVNAIVVRAWRFAGTWYRRLPMGRWWLRIPVAALHQFLGWVVLAWALSRYSHFVFLAGKSLTRTTVDLMLMRALRKRVVVIYLGTDARPPYINGSWPSGSVAAVALLTRRLKSIASLARQTRRVKSRVARTERLASVCVNAPGTSHFHERPVVNWFALGCPRSLAPAAQPGALPLPVGGTAVRRVTLVHAPSVPLVKGTVLIRAAVERLQQRGHPVDLVLMQGMRNDEVLEAIGRCDLVVDQMYSDTPMAGLALEAALLGKPALVAGYFAPQAAKTMAGLPMPPTRFVHPDDFESALEELVGDASAREALGAAARRFVDTHWQCEQVARRMIRILQGDIPESWMFDPRAVRYLEGCGLHEDAARERVRRLIEHAGPAALCLADKPELQQAYVDWAGPARHPGRIAREKPGGIGGESRQGTRE
jgi:glycosyltransferase involved in cell wall biosynthesis